MKKRMISLIMIAMMLTMLTACGSSESESTEPEAATESTEDEQTEDTATTSDGDGKMLVAYFSWSGNTEEMANTIAEQTGADVFEIEPITPYPEDYTECTEVASDEKDANARPEISNLPETLEEYDTVLIGYPIWWHTAPMIIGTFLENYELAGVQVYPFTQSASMDEEQFEESMEFVRASAGDAEVHDGLFVDSEDTDAIAAYLSENGLTQ